jgi:hypothetical protein
VIYALRSLRRSRSFAATAIITMALGIGANAALFTMRIGNPNAIFGGPCAKV